MALRCSKWVEMLLKLVACSQISYCTHHAVLAFRGFPTLSLRVLWK